MPKWQGGAVAGNGSPISRTVLFGENERDGEGRLGEMRKGGAGHPSLGFYRQRAEHSRGSSLGRRGGNSVAWRACRSGMEATGGRG